MDGLVLNEKTLRMAGFFHSKSKDYLVSSAFGFSRKRIPKSRS